LYDFDRKNRRQDKKLNLRTMDCNTLSTDDDKILKIAQNLYNKEKLGINTHVDFRKYVMLKAKKGLSKICKTKTTKN